ncbi:unnamed protein product [Closterium sp. NIES-65]|nr:unnamed protein product [Closterium sp. NIES-65]
MMIQQGEPSGARKLSGYLRKVGGNPSWSGKYQGPRVQSSPVYSLVTGPDSSPLRGLECRARTKSFDRDSTAATAAAATSAGATAVLEQEVLFETSQKVLQQQDVPRQQQQEEGRACGVGILPFLEGKHVLITGATGFIGKGAASGGHGVVTGFIGVLARVLVEKILREQPRVGQLYLLIQPTARATAAHRLTQQHTTYPSLSSCIPPTQVVPSPVFSLLRERHGEGYGAFMAGKLTAVQGNVGEDGLGLAAHAAAALHDSVDLIFNFAATVDFEAEYDVALNINTMGPRRVLAFAKKCRRLQLLVHVSTGEPHLHSHLHLRPAHMYLSGSHDAYTLCKAMGEMALVEQQEGAEGEGEVGGKAGGEARVPVVVVRPSIVESALHEPMPGWIEGFR